MQQKLLPSGGLLENIDLRDALPSPSAGHEFPRANQLSNNVEVRVDVLASRRVTRVVRDRFRTSVVRKYPLSFLSAQAEEISRKS